jgi:hypothetical protein
MLVLELFSRVALHDFLAGINLGCRYYAGARCRLWRIRASSMSKKKCFF